MIPYFKGQPTDYILRYSGGRLRNSGQGLAFFYWRYNTQIVAVPTQSQDASFVFNELTSDFQEVTLQGQITFRIIDPKLTAELFNFTIDPTRYCYLSEDHDKLGKRITNLVQLETRVEVSQRTLQDCLRDASRLSQVVLDKLRSGSLLANLGVEMLSADFLSVRPRPEVGKALEAELREALLRKADEAIYARRAAVVDEEKHIKEKELASDKTLEEQRKELIALQGANALADAENQAKVREISAEAEAKAAEMQMVVFKDMDPRKLLAYAIKEMSQANIGQLTFTTEVLANLLQELPGNKHR
jgi:regulator of protease activity HflC (stomatin/prohibitin superfamily)